MSGNHRSGSYRAGGEGSPGAGGGYGRGREGGEPPGRGASYPGRPQPGGHLRDEHGRYGSGPYPVNRSGDPYAVSGRGGRYSPDPYATGGYPSEPGGGQYAASGRSGSYSGSYATERHSGQYTIDRGSGSYAASRRSGSYSGSYAAERRSGSYRSGSYPRGGSGSHRIVHSRPPHRRLGVVLLGAATGVVVCILAVFLVLGMGGDGQESGGVANSGTATSAGTPGTGERTFVPDACQAIDDDLADELVPNADRNQSDTYQASDRQNQCVWGVYTGRKKRVLTVELRAIAPSGGNDAVEEATRRFQHERDADESGKGLLTGQRLAEKRSIEGVGEEAYAVYAVDSTQNSGEAIVNVRQGNTLITVHYSGSTGDKELAEDPAIEGAVEAAKAALKLLDSGG